MTHAIATQTTTTRDYNGTPFVFREDGWFNMTKAAKHFGKDLQSFVRMEDTVAYIDALKANSVSGTEYILTSRGRSGGTWAHPKLAVFFARWLDVRFAVWCDAMIEDILKGAAAVTITKPEESSLLSLPAQFQDTLTKLTEGFSKVLEEQRQERDAMVIRIDTLTKRLGLLETTGVTRPVATEDKKWRPTGTMSLAEYRAYRGLTLSYGEIQRAAYQARKYHQQHNIPLTFTTSGNNKTAPQYAYAVAALDHAVKAVFGRLA